MFEEALSLFLVFLLGLAGRHFLLFSLDDANTLSKVVINLTLPAVSFLVLADTTVRSGNLLVMPLFGLLIPLVLLGLALIVGRHLTLPRRTLPVFLCASSLANLGYFLYPFFGLFYGTSGMAYLVAFDVGHMIMAYGVVYLVVRWFSDDKRSSMGQNLKEVVKFPPLVAAIVGLLYGVLARHLDLALPGFLLRTLTVVGQANSLLALMILGIHFRWQIRHPSATLAALAIRMLGGLAVGVLTARVLGLDGMARIVVSLAPAMPVGLITLIYAVRYDLDAEFAASLIGVSLVLGFAVIFAFARFFL